MSIFDVLGLIGGLCLFLFGMSIMGTSLERSAGSRLELILAKLTTNKMAGLMTGLAVTGVIQSSSATTVMVVGFVNSGLMTLRQAINVIMGANIGTTVTAWILSLGGIEGSSLVLQLLKPSSFTPVLALIGIAFFMFAKSSQKKDIGTILLGFATLMYGMENMTEAVSGLADVPQFQQLFLLFENPILGVLGRCRTYCCDPIQLCLCGYPSGALRHRSGYAGSGSSDYHGTEYRHLYYGDSFVLWHQQKRPPRGYGAFKLQCDWHHRLA